MELAFLLVGSITPAIYTMWRVSGEWAWHLAREATHREFCKHEYHCMGFHEPNGFAWFIGFWVGFVSGIFWPAVAFCVIAAKINKSIGVGYTPKHVRSEARELYIKELERKAGIVS